MRSNVIDLGTVREANARLAARRVAMAAHPSSDKSHLTADGQKIVPLGMANLSADPADPDADVKLVVSLLRSVNDGSGVLGRLTGMNFSDGQAPDFLAVRSGRSIGSTLAGDLRTSGWTDRSGNTVTWFAAGEAPNAYHGVAVLFGENSSTEARRSIRRVALDGLARGRYDAGDQTQASSDAIA